MVLGAIRGPGPEGFAYDQARVRLLAAGDQNPLRTISIAPTESNGDMTAEPTTDSGRRQLVFLIPDESYRRSRALQFELATDGADGA